MRPSYQDLMPFIHADLILIYDSPKRGLELRHVQPHFLVYGRCQWHGPGDEWTLKATCLKRGALRDFAVERIVEFKVDHKRAEAIEELIADLERVSREKLGN